MNINFKAAALFAAFLLFTAGASMAAAQDTPPTGSYDDPFRLAADFAVKTAAKDDNSQIKLVKIEKGEVKTSSDNLKFNLWLELRVKEEGKKEVKRFAAAVVNRDKNTMEYSLTCWILSKRSLKP